MLQFPRRSALLTRPGPLHSPRRSICRRAGPIGSRWRTVTPGREETLAPANSRHTPACPLPLQGVSLNDAGDARSACAALRKAVKLAPHDEAVRARLAAGGALSRVVKEAALEFGVPKAKLYAEALRHKEALRESKE